MWVQRVVPTRQGCWAELGHVTSPPMAPWGRWGMLDSVALESQTNCPHRPILLPSFLYECPPPESSPVKVPHSSICESSLGNPARDGKRHKRKRKNITQGRGTSQMLYRKLSTSLRISSLCAC